MIYSLSTVHLSPTQLQAFKTLESGEAVEIRSASIIGLIEIMNLLDKGKETTFCCNPHTLRYLQSYKDRHTQPEVEQDTQMLFDAYARAIDRLKSNYASCYPQTEAAIRHQYFALLRSHGQNLTDEFDVDNRLKGIRLTLSNRDIDLSTLLTNYKRTWDRYSEIDPMQRIYYTLEINESLPIELTQWISSVQEVYNDLQKGLNVIIDEEKSRILGIKKQLSQHMVNYQHSQDISELDQMRQKIGFLMADLPKEYNNDIPKLIMFAISNWESVTAKYLARHSRRFNSRNHQSVLMYEAMQELRAVLRDIDKNGLIKVDISNTPLSYEKQIIQVEGLLDQLSFSKYWIADEDDYIAWRRFYATTTTEDKILLDLLTTMDTSYLQDQLKYIEIQKWKDNVKDKGVPTTDDSHALFEAYKELNALIDWSLVKLVPAAVNNGDYAVTFDGTHYILSNKSDSDQTTSLTLDDKNLENIKPMVTLDYYNKSKQANQLTEAVIAANSEIRTFQTKSLNIISCLDDIDNEELLRLLASAKINELKGESVSDLIKGSILVEGKEKILLVYDDVLNVQQIDHYIWQRLVLQCMSSAGYKVISINTEDALEHIGLDKYLSSYLPSPLNLDVKHAL